MKLLPGIVGLLAGTIGGYFWFLFFAFHHIYATTPRELLPEIYFVEGVYSLVILLVLGMSISRVVSCVRAGHV